MAPQVRELNSLIKQQQDALKPQYDLINADIAANDKAGAAQEAGLQAKQTQAFGNIEQAAQDKGMFFSGFSPDEQANYTADTYLPALAQLQATIAQTRSNLLGKKADLGTKAFDTAFQTRESDIAAKRDWNKMTAQQQFEAKQAQIDRDFKANQAALDRAEQAKDRAAAAAQASAGRAASAQEAFDGDRKAISNELFKVTGSDGYVSPNSYAAAKNNWMGAGYSGKSFDAYFGAYRNPANKYYKLSK